MSRLHWIGIVVVAGFELWVASLMLSPQVSAEYSDYYIARSTACWPRPVTGRYELGQVLSFRDDQAGRAASRYKQCGWVPPFEAGSWSQGSRARLRFAFAVPKQGVLLALDADGYIGPDHVQQRVEVQINGVAVDELVFNSLTQGFAGIVVTPELVALDPDGITVQFDFPDRISPAAMGVNDDVRELGMLLRAVLISPLPQ